MGLAIPKIYSKKLPFSVAYFEEISTKQPRNACLVANLSQETPNLFLCFYFVQVKLLHPQNSSSIITLVWYLASLSGVSSSSLGPLFVSGMEKASSFPSCSFHHSPMASPLFFFACCDGGGRDLPIF